MKAYHIYKHCPNNYNSTCTYAALEDSVLVVAAEGYTFSNKVVSEGKSHLPIRFSFHLQTKVCCTITHLKEQDIPIPDTNNCPFTSINTGT